MIKNVKRRQKTSEKTSETLIICEAVINWFKYVKCSSDIGDKIVIS